MSIKFMTTFLQNFINMPVTVIEDNQLFPLEFEKRHVYNTQIQTEFRADTIKKYSRTQDKPFIYHIQTALGISAVIFTLENRSFLVGPYAENEWDNKKAATLLAKHDISATELIQYQFYYSNYRIAKTHDILRIIKATLQALGNNDFYEIKAITESSEEKELKNAVPIILNFDEVTERYKKEFNLLQKIKVGNIEDTLEIYESIRKQNQSIYTHIDYLYVANASTAFRTLLRKAAAEAGVLPPVLESISRTFAQKAFTIKKISQFEQLGIEMIYEYGKAIQEVLKEHYSPVIRKVADYIKLNFAAPLELTDIAAVAGITPNYLSQVFKSETGMTVSFYIAKKRCEAAAELLLNSDLTIADISNYVGYIDSNYFVKVFKSQYKLTPSKYRISKKI